MYKKTKMIKMRLLNTIIFYILSITLITGFLASTQPIHGVDKEDKKNVCPQKNVQHWDKIIFKIKNKSLAQKVGLPINTELDIKVLDDPTKVMDVKKRYWNSSFPNSKYHLHFTNS